MQNRLKITYTSFDHNLTCNLRLKARIIRRNRKKDIFLGGRGMWLPNTYGRVMKTVLLLTGYQIRSQQNNVMALWVTSSSFRIRKRFLKVWRMMRKTWLKIDDKTGHVMVNFKASVDHIYTKLMWCSAHICATFLTYKSYQVHNSSIYIG